MRSRVGMALLRHLGFFTLLGLAVLVVAGPILALVSAILSLALAVLALLVPLALAGFLVWLALRAVCPPGPGALEAMLRKGQDAARAALARLAPLYPRAWDLGQQLGKGIRATAGFLKEVLAEGFRTAAAIPWSAPLASVAQAGAGGVQLGKRLRDGLRPLACYLGRVFIETVCGALVGSLLGTIAAWQGPPYQMTIDPSLTIGLSALGGAVLGALVGVVDVQRARQAARRIPEAMP